MFDVENGKAIAKRIMVEISPELDAKTERRRKPSYSGWNDSNDVQSAVYKRICNLSIDERSDLLAYAFIEANGYDAYELSESCSWAVSMQREEKPYDISPRFKEVAELSRAVTWSFDPHEIEDYDLREKYPYDPHAGVRYIKELIDKLKEIYDTATEYEKDVIYGETLDNKWREAYRNGDDDEELYDAYSAHLDMMHEKYGYHTRDMSDDISDLNFARRVIDEKKKFLP